MLKTTFRSWGLTFFHLNFSIQEELFWLSSPTILGINAYSKIRTKKLAITSVAFFVFAIAEIVSLLDATTVHYYNIPRI
ncbi:MAG: hypothetical protein CM1200mP23_0010 [Nitrososphaerota archaeon]|nr:MAG: hypothetical protein CM1200mP23_0010 [Nitrososphaerota archaeon]